MSFEIKFRDRRSGEQRVHKYEGNQAGAEGWAKVLSQENNCKATAERVSTGAPYDKQPSGHREHIISIGHDHDPPKR